LKDKGLSSTHTTNLEIQGDQKVSVHLHVRSSTVTPLSQHTSFLPHYLAQSDCLATDRQGQGDIRLTLTPSVIPNSNYVFMVSDWNCLKYFCMFFVLYSSGAHRLFDHPVPYFYEAPRGFTFYDPIVSQLNRSPLPSSCYSYYVLHQHRYFPSIVPTKILFPFLMSL
jgi:hypothetical protein